jgi:hypothetical protein
MCRGCCTVAYNTADWSDFAIVSHNTTPVSPTSKVKTSRFLVVEAPSYIRSSLNYSCNQSCGDRLSPFRSKTDPKQDMRTTKDEAVKKSWDSDSDTESCSSFSPQPSSPRPEYAEPTTGFLCLPREIRLEIYRLACLPLHTRHRYLRYDPASRWGKNALTLVHTYPENGALMATCRQVRWEIAACTWFGVYPPLASMNIH